MLFCNKTRCIIRKGKKALENIQYGFALNVKCVLKTFLTNPIFTAQYLLEKEDEIIDKGLVLAACEHLLKEINTFKNLENGLSDTIIDSLENNLNNLIVKCNSLKENASSAKASNIVSSITETSTASSDSAEMSSVANQREGLFFYQRKTPESPKEDTRNSLNPT